MSRTYDLLLFGAGGQTSIIVGPTCLVCVPGGHRTFTAPAVFPANFEEWSMNANDKQHSIDVNVPVRVAYDKWGSSHLSGEQRVRMRGGEGRSGQVTPPVCSSTRSL